MSELGYTRYMFIDGDLPGNGDDPSLPGHEAMMITNRNAQDAHILVNLYFEDKPPRQGPASDRSGRARDLHPHGSAHLRGAVPDPLWPVFRGAGVRYSGLRQLWPA